jgi:hypothetical protein
MWFRRRSVSGFDDLETDPTSTSMVSDSTTEPTSAPSPVITAADAAADRARFAFKPKAPTKPRVAYMSGLELPPQLIEATANFSSPASSVNRSISTSSPYPHGRSMFGRSRPNATAHEVAATAQLTSSALFQSQVVPSVTVISSFVSPGSILGSLRQLNSLNKTQS